MSSIMLVEDDPGMREFLTEVFSDSGYEIVAMPDAESAEKKLWDLADSSENGNDPVDLLIVDMELPGKSGADFAAGVFQRFPALPILAHTGVGSRENVIAFLRAGVCDYIDKPATPGDLLERAEALISGCGRTGELKRLNREMEDEIKSAKEEVLNYMHGGIKHFFAQPLTVIIGNAAILKKYAETGRTVDAELLCEVSDEITAAVQRTASLVNRLSELQDLESREKYLDGSEIIKLD